MTESSVGARLGETKETRLAREFPGTFEAGRYGHGFCKSGGYCLMAQMAKCISIVDGGVS